MQELHDKYCQRLLESYIDDNKRVKWCPSTPHCGRAVQASRACPCVLRSNWEHSSEQHTAGTVQAVGAARHVWLCSTSTRSHLCKDQQASSAPS